MTTGIWDDEVATFENVLRLIRSELPIEYVGWRIAGRAEDRLADRILFGIAGFWAHDTLVTSRRDDGTTELIVHNDGTQYNTGIIVISGEEGDVQERMRLVKSSIVKAELPPEAIEASVEICEYWSEIGPDEKSAIGEHAIIEALLNGVPLVFMTFNRVVSTNSIYGVLWHPRTFTPQDSLAHIQDRVQDYVYAEMTASL